MREEKVVKKVTDIRKSRGRLKADGRNRYWGYKKAKNLQLEGEDPGSEVMEENRKDEQGIGIGAKENVK